jgi:adenosylhomocysteine nucleosidase
VENRKLIVFSTHKEAQATFDKYNIHSNAHTPLYRYPGGHILICGMGLISATYMTSRHLHLADMVYSVGIVGSLCDHIDFGHINTISRVSKYLSFQTKDEHSISFAKKVFPTIQLEDKGVGLVSSDYPIYDQAIRAELNKEHQLVDMEGYGIAHACQMAKVPCKMFKLASDFSKKGGQHMIREMMPKLSLILAECVHSLS